MDATLAEIAVFLQVVLIDLALAADNAAAVGLAASGLAPKQQRRAIFLGILIALALRICLALITIELLQVRGLLLAGGLLLLWVAWRIWRDLRPRAGEAAGAAPARTPRTFFAALTTIAITDLSMSLDNVLAVAAVARGHHAMLVFGLVLSVLLMGVAAMFIARVIQRYPWIAGVGVAVVVFAAVRMIWEDAHNLLPALVPDLPRLLGGA